MPMPTRPRTLETVLDEAANLMQEEIFLKQEREGDTQAVAIYSHAIDILSAMSGHFSEKGTTHDQDMLLEDIGIKPVPL